MGMPSAIEYLVNAQHVSGGWGYKTAHQPVVEPTAAVLLAIREEVRVKETFNRGIAWLLSSQHQDGGWGINASDLESGWQTAWALMTMKLANQPSDVISKAVGWLTTEATYDISSAEFLKPEIPQTTVIGALVWPWLPGQATWIEPTALAVWALEGINDTPLAQARIKSALNYFDHYRTPSGGWNVGNSGPLDTQDIPRAFPTALVLIALAKIAPQMIRPDDIIALQQDMQNDSGILAQAAGLLALNILGKNTTRLISTLASQQQSDGSWEHNPFVTALATMAVRGYL
jgi:hypothetical protein